jgi:hypothetical protein
MTAPRCHSRPPLGSRIAAIVLALASSCYILYTITTIWVPDGNFGIDVDRETALVLWNRPNVMLWGPAVFLIRTHDYIVRPFVSPAIAALVIFGYAFINAIGLSRPIIFAARFPTDRPNNTTGYFSIGAAAVFISYLTIAIREYVPLITGRSIGAMTQAVVFRFELIYVAVFASLCIKLRDTSRSARAGFGWNDAERVAGDVAEAKA